MADDFDLYSDLLGEEQSAQDDNNNGTHNVKIPTQTDVPAAVPAPAPDPQEVVQLRQQNTTLRRNISALFKTAKSELARKEREIARLKRDVLLAGHRNRAANRSQTKPRDVSSPAKSRLGPAAKPREVAAVKAREQVQVLSPDGSPAIVPSPSIVLAREPHTDVAKSLGFGEKGENDVKTRNANEKDEKSRDDLSPRSRGRSPIRGSPKSGRNSEIHGSEGRRRSPRGDSNRKSPPRGGRKSPRADEKPVGRKSVWDRLGKGRTVERPPSRGHKSRSKSRDRRSRSRDRRSRSRDRRSRSRGRDRRSRSRDRRSKSPRSRSPRSLRKRSRSRERPNSRTERITRTIRGRTSSPDHVRNRKTKPVPESADLNSQMQDMEQSVAELQEIFDVVVEGSVRKDADPTNRTVVSSESKETNPSLHSAKDADHSEQSSEVKGMESIDVDLKTCDIEGESKKIDILSDENVERALETDPSKVLPESETEVLSTNQTECQVSGEHGQNLESSSIHEPAADVEEMETDSVEVSNTICSVVPVAQNNMERLPSNSTSSLPNTSLEIDLDSSQKSNIENEHQAPVKNADELNSSQKSDRSRMSDLSLSEVFGIESEGSQNGLGSDCLLGDDLDVAYVCDLNTYENPARVEKSKSRKKSGSKSRKNSGEKSKSRKHSGERTKSKSRKNSGKASEDKKVSATENEVLPKEVKAEERKTPDAKKKSKNSEQDAATDPNQKPLDDKAAAVSAQENSSKDMKKILVSEEMSSKVSKKSSVSEENSSNEKKKSSLSEETKITSKLRVVEKKVGKSKASGQKSDVNTCLESQLESAPETSDTKTDERQCTPSPSTSKAGLSKSKKFSPRILLLNPNRRNKKKTTSPTEEKKKKTTVPKGKKKDKVVEDESELAEDSHDTNKLGEASQQKSEMTEESREDTKPDISVLEAIVANGRSKEAEALPEMKKQKTPVSKGRKESQWKSSQKEKPQMQGKENEIVSNEDVDEGTEALLTAVATKLGTPEFKQRRGATPKKAEPIPKKVAAAKKINEEERFEVHLEVIGDDLDRVDGGRIVTEIGNTIVSSPRISKPATEELQPKETKSKAKIAITSANKAKSSDDKAESFEGKDNSSAGKTKSSANEAKSSADKTKCSTDKAKSSADKTKSSVDKTESSTDKTKGTIEKKLKMKVSTEPEAPADKTEDSRTRKASLMEELGLLTSDDENENEKLSASKPTMEKKSKTPRKPDIGKEKMAAEKVPKKHSSRKMNASMTAQCVVTADIHPIPSGVDKSTEKDAIIESADTNKVHSNTAAPTVDSESVVNKMTPGKAMSESESVVSKSSQSVVSKMTPEKGASESETTVNKMTPGRLVKTALDSETDELPHLLSPDPSQPRSTPSSASKTPKSLASLTPLWSATSVLDGPEAAYHFSKALYERSKSSPRSIQNGNALGSMKSPTVNGDIEKFGSPIAKSTSDESKRCGTPKQILTLKSPPARRNSVNQDGYVVQELSPKAWVVKKTKGSAEKKSPLKSDESDVPAKPAVRNERKTSESKSDSILKQSFIDLEEAASPKIRRNSSVEESSSKMSVESPVEEVFENPSTSKSDPVIPVTQKRVSKRLARLPKTFSDKKEATKGIQKTGSKAGVVKKPTVPTKNNKYMEILMKLCRSEWFKTESQMPEPTKSDSDAPKTSSDTAVNSSMETLVSDSSVMSAVRSLRRGSSTDEVDVCMVSDDDDHRLQSEQVTEMIGQNEKATCARFMPVQNLVLKSRSHRKSTPERTHWESDGRRIRSRSNSRQGYHSSASRSHSRASMSSRSHSRKSSKSGRSSRSSNRSCSSYTGSRSCSSKNSRVTSRASSRDSRSPSRSVSSRRSERQSSQHVEKKLHSERTYSTTSNSETTPMKMKEQSTQTPPKARIVTSTGLKRTPRRPRVTHTPSGTPRKTPLKSHSYPHVSPVQGPSRRCHSRSSGRSTPEFPETPGKHLNLFSPDYLTDEARERISRRNQHLDVGPSWKQRLADISRTTETTDQSDADYEPGRPNSRDSWVDYELSSDSEEDHKNNLRSSSGRMESREVMRGKLKRRLGCISCPATPRSKVREPSEFVSPCAKYSKTNRRSPHRRSFEAPKCQCSSCVRERTLDTSSCRDCDLPSEKSSFRRVKSFNLGLNYDHNRPRHEHHEHHTPRNASLHRLGHDSSRILHDTPRRSHYEEQDGDRRRSDNALDRSRSSHVHSLDRRRSGHRQSPVRSRSPHHSHSPERRHSAHDHQRSGHHSSERRHHEHSPGRRHSGAHSPQRRLLSPDRRHSGQGHSPERRHSAHAHSTEGRHSAHGHSTERRHSAHGHSPDRRHSEHERSRQAHDHEHSSRRHSHGGSADRRLSGHGSSSSRHEHAHHSHHDGHHRNHREPSHRDHSGQSEHRSGSRDGRSSGHRHDSDHHEHSSERRPHEHSSAHRHSSHEHSSERRRSARDHEPHGDRQPKHSISRALSNHGKDSSRGHSSERKISSHSHHASSLDGRRSNHSSHDHSLSRKTSPQRSRSDHPTVKPFSDYSTHGPDGETVDRAPSGSQESNDHKTTSPSRQEPSSPDRDSAIRELSFDGTSRRSSRSDLAHKSRSSSREHRPIPLLNGSKLQRKSKGTASVENVNKSSREASVSTQSTKVPLQEVRSPLARSQVRLPDNEAEAADSHESNDSVSPSRQRSSTEHQSNSPRQDDQPSHEESSQETPDKVDPAEGQSSESDGEYNSDEDLDCLKEELRHLQDELENIEDTESKADSEHFTVNENLDYRSPSRDGSRRDHSADSRRSGTPASDHDDRSRTPSPTSTRRSRSPSQHPHSPHSYRSELDRSGDCDVLDLFDTNTCSPWKMDSAELETLPSQKRRPLDKRNRPLHEDVDAEEGEITSEDESRADSDRRRGDDLRDRLGRRRPVRLNGRGSRRRGPPSHRPPPRRGSMSPARRRRPPSPRTPGGGRRRSPDRGGPSPRRPGRSRSPGRHEHRRSPSPGRRLPGRREHRRSPGRRRSPPHHHMSPRVEHRRHGSASPLDRRRGPSSRGLPREPRSRDHKSRDEPRNQSRDLPREHVSKIETPSSSKRRRESRSKPGLADDNTSRNKSDREYFIRRKLEQVERGRKMERMNERPRRNSSSAKEDQPSSSKKETVKKPVRLPTTPQVVSGQSFLLANSGPGSAEKKLNTDFKIPKKRRNESPHEPERTESKPASSKRRRVESEK